VHEFSIVQSLLEQVQQQLHAAGVAGHVRAVELVVGKISGVNTEALQFAFDVLSKNTELEGAQLRIQQPAARCRCNDCGRETELEDFTLQCPQCSSGNITITGGRELVLQSIEIQQAEV